MMKVHVFVKVHFFIDDYLRCEACLVSAAACSVVSVWQGFIPAETYQEKLIGLIAGLHAIQLGFSIKQLTSYPMHVKHKYN
jgi:hypothetical protein